MSLSFSLFLPTVAKPKVLMQLIFFQNVSSPSPCESPGCMRHTAAHHHFRQIAAGDFRSQTLNRKTVSPTSPTALEGTSATLGRRVQRGSDQKSYTCLPQWDLSRCHSTTCLEPVTVRHLLLLVSGHKVGLEKNSVLFERKSDNQKAEKCPG